MWQHALTGPGLGGVSADQHYVVIGDRDLNDLQDVFRCYSAADGRPRWTLQYPALGRLDYGNTPRATPLMQGNLVFLFGAFGDLQAVKLDSGEVAWNRNVLLDFGVIDPPKWGTCASPLIADGKLIINPGAPQAAVVALEPATGRVIWQGKGGPAAYGSLVASSFGGVRQVVGYTRHSIDGWSLAAGEHLWSVKPPHGGDFHVSTPVVYRGNLLVTSENNGTRLYEFRADGRINPKPVARNDELVPDMSTPVIVNDRLFCISGELFCLDAGHNLKTLWTADDDAFGIYGSIIASRERLLVIGKGGELLLLDARADRLRIVSRLRVFHDGPVEYYSHPALVGSRLYMRGQSALICLDLSGQEPVVGDKGG